jgi:5-methylcytosine-specific restriction endonuclease McrA
MKRDDFTCQICGLREPEIMQADHVKPESLFPELAREVANMVTLCPNCHARKTVAELKAGISHAGRKKAGTASTF